MSSEVKPRVVYKLVRTDKPEDGTDVYVGSTSRDLKTRLREHRHAAKGCNSILYKRVVEVGVYNWQILPLVICPCSKGEIRALEQQWVGLLRPDLNELSPLRENNEKNRDRAKRHYCDSLESKRYYCEVCEKVFGNSCNLKRHFKTKKHRNKEATYQAGYQAGYYEAIRQRGVDHRERNGKTIKQRAADYYEKNKEVIKQRQADYRKVNKETVKRYNTNYYKRNIQSKKFFCDVCDMVFGTSGNLKTHLKTLKHSYAYMNSVD